MKIVSRLKHGLSCGLTLGALVLTGFSPGCSASDDAMREETEVGQLGVALSTFGSSGNRFRLRNAKFLVHNVRTGKKVKTLNSEDDLDAAVVSAELESGEYSVTLKDGWFLERVGGSVPTPGPFPFPIPGPVPFPPPVTPPPGFPSPVASDAGVAFIDRGEPTLSPLGTGGSSQSSGGTPGNGPSVGGGPNIGFAGAATMVPKPVEFGEVVNAQLLTDAIVRAFVEPNRDAFIIYSFIVGDELIQFGPGRLNVGIEVLELDPPPPPPPPPPSCDPIAIERRALFETTLGATSFFNMREVFAAISGNEGFLTPPELLYGQIIDSYSTADQARLPDAVHCGDEMTNGEPTLNGFPIVCNRQERFQFDNLDRFFPTGVVNRFELAPENGAHCGNQSLVFANNEQNRMFFIFEAQIPNPNPSQGILGCQPIAEFWAAQARLENPKERGERLHQAFITGLPELQDLGVGPFITASNFTVGTGQIRTNQFDDRPWTLREFKIAVDDAELHAIPFPVGESPNGALWNDTIDTPQGPACRESFIELIDEVLTDDLELMGFPVPEECRDAESRNDFQQDYPSQLRSGNPDGFFTDLEKALDGTGLSPIDFARRAQFSGSCIGCHEEATGRNLGRGVISPFSTGFAHVEEFASSECDDDLCFRISEGIRNVFIPSRRNVLTQFVDLPIDPTCGGGSDSPSPDAGVSSGGDAGVFGPPPPSNPSKGVPARSPARAAPAMNRELANASEPVSELVEQESAIRKIFGDKTIGGQNAARSH